MRPGPHGCRNRFTESESGGAGGSYIIVKIIPSCIRIKKLLRAERRPATPLSLRVCAHSALLLAAGPVFCVFSELVEAAALQWYINNLCVHLSVCAIWTLRSWRAALFMAEN